MQSKVDEPRKEPYDSYNSEMCLAIVAVIKHQAQNPTQQRQEELSCSLGQLNSGLSLSGPGAETA